MELEEILQKELTKLKAENEELRDKLLERSERIFDITETYTKKCMENTQLKQENKELKDGSTFYNLYIQKREENTQLKDKLKEVEDCYKLGWEDGAKAAANDIASRI